MPSSLSPFGSLALKSVLPTIVTNNEPEPRKASAPGTWLRFKAWLAESGWSRGEACRQALAVRNQLLLNDAAARNSDFKSLFDRQVKAAGGFDANADASEARAVRVMTRLCGLARLAGSVRYESEAAAVTRESQAETAAAETFRASDFHESLRNHCVPSELINRFEDDFCRRCAEYSRANPSEEINKIVQKLRQRCLPSTRQLVNLEKLNLRAPESAASVLRSYSRELRDRMWASDWASSISPDHQLHRQMLRRCLELAVSECKRQWGTSDAKSLIRNAEEHCLSKIDLIADERLNDLTLDKFIERNFFDPLPMKRGANFAQEELSQTEELEDAEAREGTPATDSSGDESDDDGDVASRSTERVWAIDSETQTSSDLINRRYSLSDASDPDED